MRNHGIPSVAAAMSRVRRNTMAVKRRGKPWARPSQNTPGQVSSQPFITPALAELSARLAGDAKRGPPYHSPPSPPEQSNDNTLTFEDLRRSFLRHLPPPPSKGVSDEEGGERQPSQQKKDLEEKDGAKHQFLNSSSPHNNHSSRSRLANNNNMGRDLRRAIASYHPPLNESVLRSVEKHINPAAAAGLARRMRKALRTVKAERFWRLLEAWKREAPAKRQKEAVSVERDEVSAGIQAVELAAGIGSRLGLIGRQRCRGFIQHLSDVQVNEVLGNGCVVSLTRPTLPNQAGKFTKSLRRVLSENQTRGKESSGGEVAFLHFVLYREGVPFVDVTNILSKVSSGPPCWDSFAVNVNLEDSMICVQTCSVRLVFPEKTLAENELLAHAERELQKLLHVNLRPLPLSVQILGWKGFPCSQRFAVGGKVQYAMLLRGLTRRMNRLESLVRTCATAIPNFFAPRHFGPLENCPFRSYDVAAALERGEFAEAMMMVVCLARWSALSSATTRISFSKDDEDGINENAPWVSRAVELLEGDEERQGLWQEWVFEVLPPPLLEWICQAKGDFLWNVLVSCRIQQLRGSGSNNKESVMSAPPEPGDFVVAPAGMPFQKGEPTLPLDYYRGVKQEAILSGVFQPPHDVLSTSPTRRKDSKEPFSGGERGDAKEVISLTSAEEAAGFTLHDVLLPLVHADDCPALNALARRLGFDHAGALARTFNPVQSSSINCTPSTLEKVREGKIKGRYPAKVAFRALLVRATGRGSGVWVREFAEPLSGIGVDSRISSSAPSASFAEYRLASDLDLSAGGADFTAKSRGRRELARCRPLDRRGRAMADRLPAGLLASTALREAAATSSSSFSSSSSSTSALSKCLIMHLTLPAETYCSNLLREFVAVSNEVDRAGVVVARVGRALDEGKKRKPVEVPVKTEHEVNHLEKDSHSGDEWLDGNLLSLNVRGMAAQKASLAGLISDNLTDGRSLSFFRGKEG